MGIRRNATAADLEALSPDLLQQVEGEAPTCLGLTRLLARTEMLGPLEVARALSRLSGIPILEQVDADKVDTSLIQSITLPLARTLRILPLWDDGGTVNVAISDLEALTAVDDLRIHLGRRCRPVLMPRDRLLSLANQAFDRASRNAADVLSGIEEETRDDDEDALDLDKLDKDILDTDPNQAPIIRFVNSLLTQAVKERASDIHIEPFEKELVARYRVDGVLREVVKPPVRLQASIVSRVKIMAGLNIAEKRVPQDGRIRTRMAGREIDLRVSTLPVRHGERVVMRILEKGTVFNLDQVGMGPETLKAFRKLIRLSHGIILVTGPTGSGKTTTLYSALSEINAPDKNILTIEDPVEYELRGIGQTQVNPKINLTFAAALRSFLRQDPDIILVGEIRDRETADNAVQASLTGHLVFSTLHTNDAPTSFSRLVDMGVEPFLVSSSLVAILAQRLVRRLCPACKEPHQPTMKELRALGLPQAGAELLVRSMAAGRTVYRGVGCGACLDNGYQGRTGIYELLAVDDDIRAQVTTGANASQVRQAALANNMKTLRDDGIRKVLEGVTSLDEVLRVTQEDVVELD